MTEQPPMRASNADRERVAQILHTAMAEGRITLQELEERLDVVYAAKTLAELEPPIADLPVASEVGLEPFASRALARDNRIGGTPGPTSSTAVMTGTKRKGNWVLPARHKCFAFWGGVEIDLRDARFAQRECTITARAIMGGIEIVVPDDVTVEVDGIGLMGGFEGRDDEGAAATAPPGAPVVRINGLAFWGGVTVTRKPRDDARNDQRD